MREVKLKIQKKVDKDLRHRANSSQQRWKASPVLPRGSLQPGQKGLPVGAKAAARPNKGRQAEQRTSHQLFLPCFHARRMHQKGVQEKKMPRMPGGLLWEVVDIGRGTTWWLRGASVLTESQCGVGMGEGRTPQKEQKNSTLSAEKKKHAKYFNSTISFPKKPNKKVSFFPWQLSPKKGKERTKFWASKTTLTKLTSLAVWSSSVLTSLAGAYFCCRSLPALEMRTGLMPLCISTKAPKWREGLQRSAFRVIQHQPRQHAIARNWLGLIHYPTAIIAICPSLCKLSSPGTGGGGVPQPCTHPGTPPTRQGVRILVTTLGGSIQVQNFVWRFPPKIEKNPLRGYRLGPSGPSLSPPGGPTFKLAGTCFGGGGKVDIVL